MKTVRATILKRYTHLPALLSVLQERQLTVLSPSTWEDKNDRVFMEAYGRKKSLSTVLGLCFSQAAETFHHWKVFAPGPSGACIQFQKFRLLEAVPKSGFTHRRVTYKKPATLLGSYATASELPFIKNWAYRDEKEYRIVYSSASEELPVKTFPFQLAVIRDVVLNPWLPSALFEATRQAILQISGCSGLAVTQSKVVDNEHWQRYANEDA